MPKRIVKLASKGLEKIREDPRSLYRFVEAFVKGMAYVVFFRLFRRNVRIKLPFLVFCKKITISGPGSVFIDSRCCIFTNSFDRLTIITLSPRAHVKIGKRCDLGGVTIRCHKRVELGDCVLAASCLLQDSPFLSGQFNRRSTTEMDRSLSSEILIGKSVWLAGQTIVLQGSTIGEGSVLSQGSVCFNFIVPRNHLAVGNPVRRSVSLDVISNVLRTP